MGKSPLSASLNIFTLAFTRLTSVYLITLDLCLLLCYHRMWRHGRPREKVYG
jgi:hypothetical protein